MKIRLQSLNLTTLLGFIILPIVLILMCYGLNFFLPVQLQFPKPNIILSEIINCFSDSIVWSAISNTTLNLIKAVASAVILGIFIGLFLGLNKKIWNISQPTIDFFRSIPVTFLIPAAGLLLGITSDNIVWLLALYPSVLIIIFSVRSGIKRQEPERIHSFYITNGSFNHFKRFFKITIYEILPEIISGFRIALSYCLVIITVLEYMKIGNMTGLGGLINDELQNLNYKRVYSLIFIIGFIGFLLNKIIEILQNKFVHWGSEETH